MTALRRLGTALTFPLLAAACQTMADEPVPAVLAVMDAEAKTEIERVVSKAMHGAHVTVSLNDLTQTSTLTIEPPSVKMRGGMPIDGRSMERPTHFDLFLTGTKCVLVERKSGERYSLTAVSCKPADL